MNNRDKQEREKEQGIFKKSVILKLLNPSEVQAAIQERIKLNPTSFVIWDFLKNSFTAEELKNYGFSEKLFKDEDKTNKKYQRAQAIWAVCAQCNQDHKNEFQVRSIFRDVLPSQETGDAYDDVFAAALDASNLMEGGKVLQGHLDALCAVYDNVKNDYSEGFDPKAWVDCEFLKPFGDQLASTELFEYLRKSNYIALSDALIKQDHKLHPMMLKMCQYANDCPQSDKDKIKLHKLLNFLNNTAIAINEKKPDVTADLANQCYKVAREFHASQVKSVWYKIGTQLKKFGAAISAAFKIKKETVEARQAGFFSKKKAFETKRAVEIELISFASKLGGSEPSQPPAKKRRTK